MNNPTVNRQAGAVLFSSLIVLLVVSVIALHAARSSALEMLIATNQQNSVQALANAEDSVFLAEDDIDTLFTEGGPTFSLSDDATDGYYLGGDVDPASADWTPIASEEFTDANGNVLNRYVIEYLGTASATGGSLAVGAGSGAQIRHVYRVTGLGVGPKSTIRLVQTIFATQ